MAFDPDHWQPAEIAVPDLHELFDYKNPRAKEIAAVIQEAEKKTFDLV